eukprot:scaffold1250_cov190-Alexandrium_tamarense.AAC.15
MVCLSFCPKCTNGCDGRIADGRRNILRTSMKAHCRFCRLTLVMLLGSLGSKEVYRRRSKAKSGRMGGAEPEVAMTPQNV